MADFLARVEKEALNGLLKAVEAYNQSLPRDEYLAESLISVDELLGQVEEMIAAGTSTFVEGGDEGISRAEDFDELCGEWQRPCDAEGEEELEEIAEAMEVMAKGAIYKLIEEAKNILE